jgi:SET domain-containing protein
MNRIPGLYIAYIKNKGRGVFTSSEINPGDLIEVCPVIILPKSELSIIHKTSLHDYYFLWGKDLDKCAIALGSGSIYNHSDHANAMFNLDLENDTIDIECIRPIAAGEEILINYNGEDGNQDSLWFEIVK